MNSGLNMGIASVRLVLINFTQVGHTAFWGLITLREFNRLFYLAYIFRLVIDGLNNRTFSDLKTYVNRIKAAMNKDVARYQNMAINDICNT